MKTLKQAKSKSLLILIAAIIVLCAGFIIISCGLGPQQKIELLDEGNYAIDFSSASTSSSEAIVGTVWALKSLANKDLPSLAGTEFTIEAMVKSKVAASATDDGTTAWDETKLNGAIFSQYDSGGVIMWVKDNEPKFGIRIPTSGSTNDPNNTYSVSGGTVEITSGGWTHIAGVLVNEDHSAVHAACSAGDGSESEMPHLDIYINGQFKDCATTDYHFAVAPTYDVNKERMGIGQLVATKPYGYGEYTKADFEVDSLDITTRFEGIIDEFRLWDVARTKTEIANCWNKELGIEGACMRTSDLKIYWRFNDNTGALIHDFSGNAFNGSKKEITISSVGDTDASNPKKPHIPEGGYYPSTTPASWSYGWVTGYSF
ncbi:MAG: LamG domain-containing protein [Deferribacteres bacterium]|nr:LamG domain-containing protein [Deferribacteres bacterium]